MKFYLLSTTIDDGREQDRGVLLRNPGLKVKGLEGYR